MRPAGANRTRSPIIFAKRRHYIGLGVFVASWSTMLIPSILFPTWPWVPFLTLLLLSIGGASVLSLCCEAFVRPTGCGVKGREL